MKQIPFSGWLKQMRVSRGLEIQSLEGDLRDLWYRWENGSKPYAQSIGQIADTLGVQPIEVACAVVEVAQSQLILQPYNIFLKVMRLTRGLTFANIGELGIPSRTWASWEIGERSPEATQTNLERISRILEIGIPTLIRVLYPSRQSKPNPRRTPIKGGRIFVRQC